MIRTLDLIWSFDVHDKTLYYRAVDLPTPRERMIQLVRWYMSAFHASRNAEIAKKPYNPILGEMFKCYFNVPGYEKTEVCWTKVKIISSTCKLPKF